jgi:hypothetical protein
MYSFHKNENSSVTGETIYGWFKPFCNTKKGSMSTCKNVFGVRCQYHDQHRCSSLPTLDGECNVVRTKVPPKDEHVFSRYETCGDQDEYTAAISINQKSMACMICVHNIREHLSDHPELFIRKIRHTLQQMEEDVDFKTYTPTFTNCIGTDEGNLTDLLKDVETFLFDGNFDFGTETVNPTPKPLNLLSYKQKTYKCDTCIPKKSMQNCRCKKMAGGSTMTVSAFEYKKDPQFQKLGRQYKTIERMLHTTTQSYKRKRNNAVLQQTHAARRTLQRKKEEYDWKKNTLWYIGMVAYCAFFNTIPAIKPNVNQNELDCDTLCKQLYKHTNKCKKTNFVDVKNLLLSFRILKREFDNASDAESDDDTSESERMNRWLQSKMTEQLNRDV